MSIRTIVLSAESKITNSFCLWKYHRRNKFQYRINTEFRHYKKYNYM